MRTQGQDMLIRFKRRWQMMLCLEILLYALGPAVLVYFLTYNFLWSFVGFLVVSLFMAAVIRPWKLSLEHISGYIDQNLEVAEYSTGLLLLNGNQISGLGKLQQHKVAKQLGEQLKRIKPANHLFRAGSIMALFVVLSFLAYQFDMDNLFQSQHQQIEQQEIIIFKPTDSISTETEPPVLENQQVTISYPAYTGIPYVTTSKMDVEAVEGSRLTWQLKFDVKVDSVTMESMGNSYPMKINNEAYTRTSVLNTSGFYNFRFTDPLGRSYLSELYSIEATSDRAPAVEVQDLKHFTSFDFDEGKQVSFRTIITDDFGIAEAYIIATVSKGSGESVKFREEKLDFDDEVGSGNKTLKLSKNIDLDDMKMEPGDELYFYIEALDLKQPQANRSRSETFFAVIKDTTSYEYAVEGSMGVDLMPDYFRSQRQLIIDTQNLISNRPILSKKEFNSTSNELGFDQKALRLKYGQFMGDESESGLANQDHDEMPVNEDDAEDPLAGYTHDHDGANEHNLVDQDHEEHEDAEVEDPLGDYLHNHDDPEESSLYTESLKSKLRQALNIMWDAELHLRLYEPEKSLPYQFQALELIQEIKNSARIYVHRIGFDPPPIKEDKRLTGDIEEVTNFRKTEKAQEPELYPFMRQSISRFEQLISDGASISEEDQKLFEQAGNELATKAVEEPGKYLKTLQQLKWLTEDVETLPENLAEVQRGLLMAIPEASSQPGKNESFKGELNELLLKELELNDR